MRFDNAYLVDSDAPICRQMGLHCEVWACKLSATLEAHRQTHESVTLSWQQQVRLAVCMQYPIVGRALRRIERQLASYKTIKLQGENGQVYQLL